MPRTLTAARVRVRPDVDASYRRLLAERARAVQARGAHFWVFRSRTDPGAYLEFVESGAARDQGERELQLERESRALAAYAPDADDVWEEVECRDA